MTTIHMNTVERIGLGLLRGVERTWRVRVRGARPRGATNSRGWDW